MTLPLRNEKRFTTETARRCEEQEEKRITTEITECTEGEDKRECAARGNISVSSVISVFQAFQPYESIPSHSNPYRIIIENMSHEIKKMLHNTRRNQNPEEHIS